jgi:carbon storage regulator
LDGVTILFKRQGILILSRKLGESIFIGDDIQVIVAKIKPGKVRLAIQAPKELEVDREEIRAKLILQGRRKKGNRPW